jgi:transcriptional regulator with XRE-family HTH domain
MPLDDALGPDPIDIAIGARIRIRRKTIGVSQGLLAERIGVSFQQVQKYERGANRVSGSTLVAVAAALDTTVGWLVGEDASAPGADDLLLALAINGAQDLLAAYAGIGKASARNALVTLAEEMAAADS